MERSNLVRSNLPSKRDLHQSYYKGSDEIKTTPFKNTSYSKATFASTSLPTYSADTRTTSKIEQENQQLRAALLEAIEQNEFLRDRLQEMEALLAVAQEQIEENEERYIVDMNQMHREIQFKRKTTKLEVRPKSL